MHLALVRHAQPDRDAADRADPGLSALGREQAARVADFLAGEPVDAVYTSPQRRAAETAAVIGERTGCPVRTVTGLAEFDHGAGEYLHFDDLYAARDPRFFACMAGDLSPWGTDRATFGRRYTAAIAELTARHPQDHVVAVTHGGVLNGYLGSVLGLESLFFFDPQHASISRVRSTAKRTDVQSINESGHLRRARVEQQ